ncbi:MAG: methionyl-tRNA formyltransferase [Oscillospiraceae bacterium]|nr:methionyl-tRNA formyltransferase [Oscillospiraceae bacterium]
MKKIIFMGTSEFAVSSLFKLVSSGFDVALVVTQPDKVVGRNAKLTAPPIKVFAQNHQINVFQPKALNEPLVLDFLRNFEPDFIVVAAYGKILSKNILEIPKLGSINVHASLLPALRGAAPVQWSILNGLSETGVTIMMMDEGVDTGDILFQKSTIIDSDETSGELLNRLSKIGAELLIFALRKIIESGQIGCFRKKQNENLASYSYMLRKKDGIIDWSKNSSTLHNFVRGMNPWPVAFTYLDGKMLKIYTSKPLKNLQINAEIGEVFYKNPLRVLCAQNTALELLEVQLEGKRKMSSQDFVKGYKFKEKTLLK